VKLNKITIDTENKVYEINRTSFANGCLGYSIVHNAPDLPLVTLTMHAQVEFRGEADIETIGP